MNRPINKRDYFSYPDTIRDGFVLIKDDDFLLVIHFEIVLISYPKPEELGNLLRIVTFFSEIEKLPRIKIHAV